MALKINKQVKQDPTVTDIDRVMERSDGLRKLGLEQAAKLQSVKSAVLAREQERLKKELGDDHPEVAIITKRLKFAAARQVVIHREVSKLEIEVDDIDQTTTLVHGRILDKTHQPLPGLTVSLADEQGQWLRIWGYSETNDKGYFSLQVKHQADQEKEQAEEELPQAYLLVTDKSQRKLHQDQVPIELVPGKMIYREVLLKKLSAPSPPQKDESEVIVDQDVWKVVGRIMDNQQRPVAQATVRLYDKDHQYDDLLGKTKTDNKGEFELSYRTEDFKESIDAWPDLYIKVSDQNGQVLHESKKAVRYNAGKVEKYDVVLSQIKNEKNDQLKSKAKNLKTSKQAVNQVKKSSDKKQSRKK